MEPAAIAVCTVIGGGVSSLVGEFFSEINGETFIDGFSDGYMWGSIGGTGVGLVGGSLAQGAVNSGTYVGETLQNGGKVSTMGVIGSFDTGAVFYAVGTMDFGKLTEYIKGRPTESALNEANVAGNPEAVGKETEILAKEVSNVGVKDSSQTVKSGITQLEPYSGVKQASQFLKEQGFSRSQRVEYLQSFDVRTIYMDVADGDTYGIRFHDFGKSAYPKGRYLYETFSPLSTREGAAIKQSWNEMTGIKQWKVQEGTTIIKGKAAPQIENGYQYNGGVEQWFINNTKYLEEP